MASVSSVARSLGFPGDLLVSGTVANPKPNQMMTCPYNKAHQIEHYRMQFHLEKCRKQYPKSTKATCPFNATHVVEEAELDFHVSTCPDRFLFDNQKHAIEDGVQPRQQPQVPVIEAEERWEDEPAASYVPDLSSKPHIIRKVKGATPAERRRARMEGVRNYRPQQH